MAGELKINSQVRLRDTANRGSVKVVRIGTVLAYADKEKKIAVVSFPQQNLRKNVPVEQLEPVSSAYGRDVVQVNPLRRSIASLLPHQVR